MNTNKYSSVRLFFATLSLMVCAFPVFLQAQTLSGSVRDADNGSPIGGASVQLFRMQSESTPLGLASDPDGLFTFEGLKPGYYRCEISAVGYDTRSFGELLVAAGKDQRLEATLLKSNNTLPDVTISAVRFGARPVQPLGEVALTRDQTLRFPAMFFDPGRLAAVYPGAVQTDDGTNGLSIRGNNPSALRWRLFGADVVNPNHLPNAGTFSDRAVAAGGGVLMFSAQMMDNSALLTGNYRDEQFPFELVEIAGGYQFMTKGAHHHIVSVHLKQTTKKRLSQAALETLAIVAYKQPVTKSDLEEIRGVNCDYALQKLLEKELVMISGRSDGPGRPLLYATTDKFMDYMGINSLNDLPKPKEFKETENSVGTAEQ